MSLVQALSVAVLGSTVLSVEPKVRPSESAGPTGLDQTLEYWLDVLYVPLAPLTVC